MELQKKRFLALLDKIAGQQKELSECHDYYYKLEKELDRKRERLANSEDVFDLTCKIETLNREYEEKTDPMLDSLNETLTKGHDLAKKMGNEIAYDFEQLWNYMTDSMHQEVELEKVLKEINRIKRDFLS